MYSERRLVRDIIHGTSIHSGPYTIVHESLSPNPSASLVSTRLFIYLDPTPLYRVDINRLVDFVDCPQEPVTKWHSEGFFF